MYACFPLERMQRKDFLVVNKIYEKFVYPDYKRLLQEPKIALKKSQWKNYYKILSVDSNAKTDEIQKASKKRALVHHPGVYLCPNVG